jgi:hypothetical protein
VAIKSLSIRETDMALDKARVIFNSIKSEIISGASYDEIDFTKVRNFGNYIISALSYNEIKNPRIFGLPFPIRELNVEHINPLLLAEENSVLILEGLHNKVGEYPEKIKTLYLFYVEEVYNPKKWGGPPIRE